MSQKAKPIDLDQVERAASVGCTVDEIATIVGLSGRQFQRRQKEPAFLEAVERGRAMGRASMRKTQWQSAQGFRDPDGKYVRPNVTAQIWVGKQFLGQRSFERPEPPKPPEKPGKMIYEWVDPPNSEDELDTSPSPASESSTAPEPDSKASVDPLDQANRVH